MSRRATQGETGFGSDSFLDIVANIVGILIILIVIAGIKMSQAPVMVAENQEAILPNRKLLIRIWKLFCQRLYLNHLSLLYLL